MPLWGKGLETLLHILSFSEPSGFSAQAGYIFSVLAMPYETLMEDMLSLSAYSVGIAVQQNHSEKSCKLLSFCNNLSSVFHPQYLTRPRVPCWRKIQPLGTRRNPDKTESVCSRPLEVCVWGRFFYVILVTKKPQQHETSQTFVTESRFHLCNGKRRWFFCVLPLCSWAEAEAKRAQVFFSNNSLTFFSNLSGVPR